MENKLDKTNTEDVLADGSKNQQSLDIDEKREMQRVSLGENLERQSDDGDGIGNTEKKNTFFRDILEMILYFAVVIVSVILIHQYIGQQIEVSGSSMESTLHNEDHLILEKISYEIGEPKRFDIVVFRPYQVDKDTYYIKRVIGMPGETIQIIGSDIYINGQILEEDYGNEPIMEGGIAAETITLGQDEYFLMGDNRNNSKDSRDSSIGPVKRSAIIGRAWVRIWPLDEFGILEHQ